MFKQKKEACKGLALIFFDLYHIIDQPSAENIDFKKSVFSASLTLEITCNFIKKYL